MNGLINLQSLQIDIHHRTQTHRQQITGRVIKKLGAWLNGNP